MKSSSSDVVRPAFGGELRTGNWTRLGDSSVLGDAVTEQMLSGIAESARVAAQAQGYAVGWAEGRRAAEEQGRQELAAQQAQFESDQVRRESEHQAALALLRAASEQVRASAGEVCDAVERHAISLAVQVTETILDRELVAEPGADAVRRALALLPAEPLVRIHLNPEDIRSTDVDAITDLGATVVPDASLLRGDVVISAEDHIIDGRISTALDRVREVLGA
jgi:flagellar assembly protein FliH